MDELKSAAQEANVCEFRIASSDLRSTSLSRFSSVDCCKTWACEHIFDASAMPWLDGTVSRNRIAAPIMFFKMLERCWPGSVFLGKGKVDVSEKLISRGYLNTVPAEMFTDALYTLLLGRAPDDAGREHYDAQIRNGVSRDELIDHVLASAEFKEMSRDKRIVSTAESDFNHVKKLIHDDLILYHSVGRSEYLQPRSNVLIGEIAQDNPSYFIFRIDGRIKPILAVGMTLVGQWEQSGEFTCGKDWIVFGPRINLRRGTYEIVLDIEAPSDFLFRFDACYNEGHEVVFSSVHRGDLKVSFCVTLQEQVQDFELRLFNSRSNIATLKINEISIRSMAEDK